MKKILNGEKNHILATYMGFPIAMRRGKGSWLWDEAGNNYLDFFTGIAVHPLGHAHPAVVRAIAAQAARLSHTTNLFYSAPQVELAALLVKHSFASKVAFANSGAEANELCIKIARRWGAPKGRHKIIAMQNSFHGRTYGALSATGQPAMHKPFGPMLSGFKHVPLNNLAALRKALDNKTCAVMLESVQGEGGICPADIDYLKAVRRLCDAKGLLLIVDEIQTGLGRTGKLWGYQQAGPGFKPDLASLGKSLGGGLPLSAVLVSKKCETLLAVGGHGTTLGGNPVACAAGSAMLKALLSAKLAQKSAATGRQLAAGLRALGKKYGVIQQVRGRGLMLGAVLDRPSAPLVADLLRRGLVANATAGNVLRLLPPLNLNQKDLNTGLGILEQALAAIKRV
jgi:predicted acetylornithine/succinylornithine family transaminase